MIDYMTEQVINDEPDYSQPSQAQKEYKDFDIEKVMKIIENTINDQDYDIEKLYKKIKNA